MNLVLQKTVASLETALKYNPENVELVTSLAEGYIRLGRLDGTTLGLCERALAKYPENTLLQQAQAVAYVIEQTDTIDAGLAAGRTPPDAEAISSSAGILDEFLKEIDDSAAAWFAWTRLSILAGQMEDAALGMRKLEALRFDNFVGLRRALDWIAKNPPAQMGEQGWIALFDGYARLGEPALGLKTLERAFDSGISQPEIGRLLLLHYSARYSPANADQVPEAMRPRLFQIMLDYGDPELTGEWLRRAALFGWEITNYSKAYVGDLINNNQLETAFEILQRMPLDRDVKQLLDRIATEYEKIDKLEDAVRILQYINNHELVEEQHQRREETVLAREMELSLGELAAKNGRNAEAVGKFVTALLIGDEPDAQIADRIDELISAGGQLEAAPLLRLAAFFRRHKDHPKTVFYLNHALEIEPENSDALRELANLFEEILLDNPDNPELRLELGKVHLRMKDYERATSELAGVLGHPSLGPRAGRLLATAYRRLGKLREALTRFQELPIGDNDLESLYDLHLEFARAEDMRGAIMALEMITRVKADYRDAAHRLAQIENQRSKSSVSEFPAGDAKMRELIGDLSVGRYRHIEKIGSGGMGVVHKVYDNRLQKVVAMKILRDGLAGSSKALDRFFREARIAASIHHRNIVDIHDYNISSVNGQSYICMEFVDGPSVREIVDKQFDATVSIGLEYIGEMLYYFVQIFDALECTHQKGIIHRDIKPDNVMVTSFGEAKLTDFGIVHVEEATFTPTGAMLGTPRYMSPEQVTGGKIDGRSDIYSVGICLYECLTGSPPFLTGDISYQQVNKKPIEPRSVSPVIPKSVNDFIMKCLEKSPEARYSAAQEAKGTLAGILESLGGCKKWESMTRHGEDSPPASQAAANAYLPELKKEALGDLDLDMPDAAGADDLDLPE